MVKIDKLVNMAFEMSRSNGRKMYVRAEWCDQARTPGRWVWWTSVYPGPPYQDRRRPTR